MSTKRLARKLGLVRKHRHEKKAKGAEKQSYAFLIVLDFESTCWKNRKEKRPEIIEFPAVLLNVASGEIESKFQEYVQPTENPHLSEFCQKFTGIQQNQVTDSAPLSAVLRLFLDWIKRLEREKDFVCAGSDGQSENEKRCTLVTWSDWDLGVCLHYECKRKQIRKPAIFNTWIDLRATYRSFYERIPRGLNGALEDLGLEFEGRQHSGLDDAKNTAKLCWQIIQDGCILLPTASSNPPAPVVQRPALKEKQ
ncbi:ERI1 exoribonuclease 2-like [Oscarella lobularis]|uniref:ERI1 exoribonuclease 2-like n=1 Tax=Oscarella lobularis TaxID=121494 RepID=UPI003313898E